MHYEYMVREFGAGSREGGEPVDIVLEATLNHDPVQADGWELWQVAGCPGKAGVLLLIYRRDHRSASAE
jgi:hypothetical protein